jgi:hypothetical protein
MSASRLRPIAIKTSTGEFAEDKDLAASLREGNIRPAIREGQSVTIDFTGIKLATQSFVHALISDILRTDGEKALDRLYFKGTTTQVKSIIQTVVQYSLESIEPGQEPEKSPPSQKRKR